MASLKRKPNGVWYLDVQIPGPGGSLKRSRVGLDTRDRADAEAQRREWLAGTHPKHPAKGLVEVAPRGRSSRPVSSEEPKVGLTVARWLDLCCTTLWRQRQGPSDPRGGLRSNRNHLSAARIIPAHLPDGLLLADLTAAHLQAMRDSMLTAGYAATTVAAKLRIIGAALTHAAETIDPATGLPYITARPKLPRVEYGDKRRERVLSYAEEDAILEAIEERQAREPGRDWFRFKALLVVMMDTAFRLSEALSFSARSVREVDWSNPVTGESGRTPMLWVSAEEAKGHHRKPGKARGVPMSDRVLALVPVLNQLAGPGGRWFPWGRGSSTPWAMLDAIRSDLVAKGVDLSDVVLHTFRHTCGNRLYDGGMDLKALSEWMGHADIAVTAKVYLKSQPQKLMVGASILNRPNIRAEDGAPGGNPEGPSVRSNRAQSGTVTIQ